MSSRRLAPLLVALALLLPAAGWGDEPDAHPIEETDPVAEEPADEPEPPVAAEPQQPAAPDARRALELREPRQSAGDGRTAVNDWHDRRGIGYGTDYLFPFTRGLSETGMPEWAQYPLWAVTLPLDAVHLPLGVVAGLWGR